MINAGLIGFGFAGRTFHAPIIGTTPGLRLSAILQRTGTDARTLYPESAIVPTIDELLSDSAVDLIVIATPNQSHSALAKQCLLAGRHVVIDKPFTTTSVEARELIELAKSKGKLLSVYHNRRWDGDFQTVRNLVKEGTVGRVVMFESHFDRFRPELKAGAWREKNEPGSGVLFDLGSHLLDQAMTLFGTPEAIEADVRIERDGAEVDDAFDVTLFYPQGRALLRASMLASIPGARFTVRGTQGSYVKHGMDPQEDALKLGQRPTQQGWGMDPEDNWGTLSILEEGNLSARKVRTLPGDYRGFYENVRDAIEKGSKLAVSAQDAFSVMVGMELALESSRSGRRIPWPK